MNCTEFEITPSALAQLKRVGDVVRFVLHGTTGKEAAHRVSARDVAAFSRLMELIEALPNSLPGEDITLSIFSSERPNAPYKRFQFGEKVIDVGELQVEYDPTDNSEWTGLRMFGAILGMGAGCKDERFVQELQEWIDQLLRDLEQPALRWQIEIGNQIIGHVHYPNWLVDD